MNDIINAIIRNIISIIAVSVAILSAFIAYRALLLNKSSFKKKQANFNLYLIDAYRLINEKLDNRKFLLFHLTVNNRSENKSSYHATLYLEYIRTDNSVEKILLLHSPELAAMVSKEDLSVFPKDIRIEENASQSKWLIFEQPKTIKKEYRIDSYCIALTDVNGMQKNTAVHLMKDILYESTNG